MECRQVLSLEENPCGLKENYRLKVLHYLPQLTKLDSIAVTEKEVRNAHMLFQMDGDVQDTHTDTNHVSTCVHFTVVNFDFRICRVLCQRLIWINLNVIWIRMYCWWLFQFLHKLRVFSLLLGFRESFYCGSVFPFSG